jgi:5'-nucleotidase
MEILLTNDDGIDAEGLGALRDALTEIGDVTVVAPADDKSAVGRAMSHEVDVVDHEHGFAVEGTPTDCVIAALGALDCDPDLVVAGCNRGANLGEYVLGRSGTVSAAVEAAFYGVPAMAVSLYVPVGRDVTFEDVRPEFGEYAEACRAARYLAEQAPDAGVFADADYLNVNAPVPDESPTAMRVTRPSHVYEMDAVREGNTVHIEDRVWTQMAEGDISDPEGTDRRAIVEGDISVSPLTAPHTTHHHETLDDLAAAF